MGFFSMLGIGFVVLMLLAYIIEYPSEAKLFAKRMMVIGKNVAIGIIKFILKTATEIMKESPQRLNSSIVSE